MKPQELTIGQKAKSILLERGWRQGGVAFGGTHGLCMVEALGRASAGATSRHIVQRFGFRSTLEAIDWNDAPGRTFEQVLERLEWG
jgi:hypothetical protein